MSSPIIKLPQVPNNLDPELRDYLLNINKILIKKQNEEFGGFKKQVVDLLYPIGERYIQLPEPNGTFSDAKSPEVKFGGEWACIFDTEGAFFKTEGHEPTQYYKNNVLTPYRDANGLAEDKVQIMSGTLGRSSLNNCGWSRNTDYKGTGVFATPSGTDGTSSVHGLSSGNYLRVHPTFNSRLSPNAKTTLNTNGRTEPVNRLMRIWERFA